MSLDIFNPQISVVSSGLEGKIILLYGSNSLGKTKQSTRMKKPYYLGFEKGLGAISGIPFAPINKWSDFKKVNRQLTSPGTIEKAKELYQTIIFDEVEASSRYCQKYICDLYESDSIKTGNEGYGLWKEYELEYWTEIDKLLGAGYTVAFIAHQDFNKELDKIYPKGDKRALAPVVDNSDVIVYLRSNGVDEKGNSINSSAYFLESKDFFARSRFSYIQSHLPEFTSEALEDALIKAIKKQEEIEGIKSVTYEQKKEVYNSGELDFEKIVAEITELGKKFQAAKRLSECSEIIESHIGKNKKIKECTKSQVEALSLILDEIKELPQPKVEPTE